MGIDRWSYHVLEAIIFVDLSQARYGTHTWHPWHHMARDLAPGVQ
jgi:hypothetical protein